MGRIKGSKNKPKNSTAKKLFIPAKFYNDSNFELASFIIDKFLDKRELTEVYRNYTTAIKLAKKFSSKAFWASIPCEFRVKNISNFLFGKALDKLSMLFCIYSRNLSRDKKIKIDAAPLIEYKLEEIDIEENMIAKRKPKTILEFCK